MLIFSNPHRDAPLLVCNQHVSSMTSFWGLWSTQMSLNTRSKINKTLVRKGGLQPKTELSCWISRESPRRIEIYWYYHKVQSTGWTFQRIIHRKHFVPSNCRSEMRMAKKTWTHPIKSCCHPKMNIFSQRMTFDRGYPVINKRVSKLVTPPKKAHGRTKDKWQGMEIWSSQFETTFSSPLRLCSGWGLKSCEP